MLTKHQLDELASQLPTLKFDLKADIAWKKIQQAQTYLTDYQIDFSNEFSGIKHGFGKIDSAKFSIATHYWIPKKPIATLVLVHGYFDHVGIYQHIIRHALKKNLTVLAFDLPGHGLSSGEPVVIDSFDEYTQVLEDIFSRSQSLLPAPYFAAGQSTGSAILLNYVWRNRSVEKNEVALKGTAMPFEKIFLCSPLILSRGWRGFELGAIAYEALKYFLRFVKRGPANSSHDPAFNHFIQVVDPMQSKHISMRWIGAMKVWNERFNAFTPLQTKLTIVQGTDDHTVDWQYNIPLIQSKLPNARVEYVAGAGHQLVNESEALRAEVFAHFDHCFFEK